MAMIVNDRHLLRKIMIELLRNFGVQQKILV
jgi:hypothetical protein